MKYLLVIALVLVVFWLWRSNRQAGQKCSAAAPRPRQGARSKRNHGNGGLRRLRCAPAQV